jgi:hypothetical protein
VATGTGFGWVTGDVIVYSSDFGTSSAQAFVDWTAQVSGTITISGEIWYASSVDRSDDYVLALDGSQLATGGFAYLDGTSRTSPRTFNGGGTFSVNPGNVVSLEIFNPTRAFEGGSFAGIDLRISETSSAVPEPGTGSFGLLGIPIALLGMWRSRQQPRTAGIRFSVQTPDWRRHMRICK